MVDTFARGTAAASGRGHPRGCAPCGRQRTARCRGADRGGDQSATLVDAAGRRGDHRRDRARDPPTRAAGARAYSVGLRHGGIHGDATRSTVGSGAQGCRQAECGRPSNIHCRRNDVRRSGIEQCGAAPERAHWYRPCAARERHAALCASDDEAGSSACIEFGARVERAARDGHSRAVTGTGYRRCARTTRRTLGAGRETTGAANAAGVPRGRRAPEDGACG